MNVICVEHLTRDYGGGKGVFDATFQVQQGEVFGFLGPNGAGKTTTIRHLMGFLRPQAGACTIAGLDCWRERARIQAQLGYVPGEISFFDDMTGVEYLKFLERYRNLRGSNRKGELLDYFQLEPKGKIKKMSKGMKQKLGLVAALMHDPDILIFDEPTSGLDYAHMLEVSRLLRELAELGLCVLVITHDGEFLRENGARVISWLPAN